MKTRAQIYSHEASGILRDISTYGILTQKQILGLYPQKDEQIKNLLTYLCKQKRLFLVDGFYSLTPAWRFCALSRRFISSCLPSSSPTACCAARGS